MLFTVKGFLRVSDGLEMNRKVLGRALDDLIEREPFHTWDYGNPRRKRKKRPYGGAFLHFRYATVELFPAV